MYKQVVMILMINTLIKRVGGWVRCITEIPVKERNSVLIHFPSSGRVSDT